MRAQLVTGAGAGSAGADAAAGSRRRGRRGSRSWRRRRFGGLLFAAFVAATFPFLAFVFGFFAFFFFAVFVFVFVFVAAAVAGAGGVAAVQAGEFRQARGGFEFGAFAFLGGFHVGAPDRAGGGAAVAGVFARGRVADPDRGREHRREADEPGVGLFLGGAGLARLRAAAHVGVAGAGALGDHALEDLRDGVGLPGREDAFAVAAGELVDVAVGELDAAD